MDEDCFESFFFIFLLAFHLLLNEGTFFETKDSDDICKEFQPIIELYESNMYD